MYVLCMLLFAECRHPGQSVGRRGAAMSIGRDFVSAGAVVGDDGESRVESG